MRRHSLRQSLHLPYPRLWEGREVGDREAQEFWDRMWVWEKYECFPTETVDDPHLVVQLASEVDAAGDNVDPILMSRYDGCVGRVLQRLTNQFPRNVELLDEAELKHWLQFGLRSSVRGHDQEITPIIDANSLIIFRFFTTHAVRHAERHGRNDLRALWEKVAEIARQADDEHAETPKASRFEPAGNTACAE